MSRHPAVGHSDLKLSGRRLIYFNVLFLSIGKTGLFDRFVMYQTDMYIYGISVFNNIVLPVIIWAVCAAVSFLTFRFYRKDMLKN